MNKELIKKICAAIFVIAGLGVITLGGDLIPLNAQIGTTGNLIGVVLAAITTWKK